MENTGHRLDIAGHDRAEEKQVLRVSQRDKHFCCLRLRGEFKFV